MTRFLAGAAAFVAALLVALLGIYANADAPRSAKKRPAAGSDVVKLRLLGVNDFHGHLEPPRPGIGGAGRAQVAPFCRGPIMFSYRYPRSVTSDMACR